MNKLEELIQQYCPDGVEYVRFVDYANVLYGCPFNAAQFTNDSSYIPLIRIRDVLSGKASTYYKGEYSHDYIIKKGDILVGMDGNFNLGIWDDIDGLLCQRVCKLYTKDETRLLNGFIRHYMKPVFRQIEEGTPGGSVKHLSAKAINSIHIPLPPLPVQEEIVRILDNFTELQAELQAELQKRKLQYNYYLDNLLNFNRGGYQAEVRWMKMSEVMSISRGASPRPIQNYLTDADDGIPWIKIGDVSPSSKYISSTKEKIKKEGATKSRYLKKGDFILSNSMSFGRPYILNIDGCIHDGWISMYGFEEHLDQDYLYYVLRSESVQTFWTAKANSGGAVSNLNSDIVRNTLIPIPSMTEQKKIVSILNRFDTLTNDLTAGLPAEIEKRRQQYEYYRDKLLTFKRKAA